MPPPSPRDRPALERSLPADAATAGRLDGSAREVLFGDGTWRLVRVRAWRKDRQGRDVIDVEWHAGGDSWAGCVRGGPREDPRAALGWLAAAGPRNYATITLPWLPRPP